MCDNYFIIPLFIRSTFEFLLIYTKYIRVSTWINYWYCYHYEARITHKQTKTRLVCCIT